MNYQPWTVEQKQQLQSAVDAGLKPAEIHALFPGRTAAAVSTKVKYESHKAYINASRAAGRGPEALAISDADAISADIYNQKQDGLFQDAMRAAIKAGLEQMPAASAVDYAEFRPAPFHPVPRVSYGGSPAAQCAELGSL